MSSPDITPLDAVCVLQAADMKCVPKSQFQISALLSASIMSIRDDAECKLQCAWAVITASSKARSGHCSYDHHPQTISAKFYGRNEPNALLNASCELQCMHAQQLFTSQQHASPVTDHCDTYANGSSEGL